MPKLQPEEFRIVESPAGHSAAGTGSYALATSRCRRPVGHPSNGMTPIHRADTYLAENEATAIDDGEGIGRTCSPLVTTSRYPPLGSLVRINRLDGLSTHERIRERGHHRPGILGLPSPQHQARRSIYKIAHDASLPQQASPVTSVSPAVPLRRPNSCQGRAPASTTVGAVISRRHPGGERSPTASQTHPHLLFLEIHKATGTDPPGAMSPLRAPETGRNRALLTISQ